MLIPLAYKRPFIWLSRFTHRRGYGIHSPFAFQLITNIFYERLPYYGYAALKDKEHDLFCNGHKELFSAGEPLKLRRLLFRLANFIQPAQINFVGQPTVALDYLKEACPHANFIQTEGADNLPPRDVTSFTYIRYNKDVEKMSELCRQYMEQASSDSLLVIQGVGYSRRMKRLWKALKEDEKAGITFDLYYIGLIFFDHSKIKQHYIVNF